MGRVLSASASSQKLTAIAARVAAVGQNRVKPCVYFKSTAQIVSMQPAATRMSQSMLLSSLRIVPAFRQKGRAMIPSPSRSLSADAGLSALCKKIHAEQSRPGGLLPVPTNQILLSSYVRVPMPSASPWTSWTSPRVCGQRTVNLSCLLRSTCLPFSASLIQGAWFTRSKQA